MESWFLFPQTSQVTALRAISSEGTFYGLGKSRNDAKGRKYLIFRLVVYLMLMSDTIRLIVSYFCGIHIKAPQIPFMACALKMSQERLVSKNVKTHFNHDVFAS